MSLGSMFGGKFDENVYAIAMQFIRSSYAVLKIHVFLLKMHVFCTNDMYVLKLQKNCIRTA